MNEISVVTSPPKIHEANDGIVHVGREGALDHKLRLSEFGQTKFRRRWRLFDCARIACNKQEHDAVGLMRRKTAHADSAGFVWLAFNQRRDLFADSVLRAKAPAVVRALDRLAAVRLGDPASRERHGAMRADIAERERGAIGVATEHDRLAHDLAPEHGPALQFARRRGEVPKVPKKLAHC
jgi:hypothetical protein